MSIVQRPCTLIPSFGPPAEDAEFALLCDCARRFETVPEKKRPRDKTLRIAAAALNFCVRWEILCLLIFFLLSCIGPLPECEPFLTVGLLPRMCSTLSRQRFDNDQEAEQAR